MDPLPDNPLLLAELLCDPLLATAEAERLAALLAAAPARPADGTPADRPAAARVAA